MKALALVLLSVLLFGPAAAQVVVSANSNWSSIGATSGDDIVITDGATLTVNVSDAACASVRIGSNVVSPKGNGVLAFNNGSILHVSGDVNIGQGASRSGSIVMSLGGTLKVGGSINVDNLGTFTAGTGTVEFDGGVQTVPSALGAYNNLTLSGSGAKTVTGVIVNGKLSLQGAGTSAGSTPTYGVNAVLEYKGSNPQTTQIELPATMNNQIIIDNLNGIALGANTVLNNILTITSGKLSLGTNNLTIGSSGSIAGVPAIGSTATHYIVTNLTGVLTRNGVGATQVLFPIGTSSSYNPVAISNSGTPGAFSAKVQAGFVGLPDGAPGPTQPLVVVNRAWSISESGGGKNASVTLQYNDGEFNPVGFSTTLNFMSRYNGTQWVAQAATEAGIGPYTSEASGYTAFSSFGLTSNTNALPIQLGSFAGTVLSENRVKLDWMTVSEVNNYGFHVQKRALNSSEWAEIEGSFVAGHGTTNEPQRYTYTDNAGITEATYYRLRQVDLDGSAHFTEPILVSGVTGVVETAPVEFALLQNYPNPFNPSTEIKFSVEASGNATLDVYNALGQKVATLFNDVAESGKYYKVRFDAAGLASGMYFYRLTSGNKSDLKKLVLMK